MSEFSDMINLFFQKSFLINTQKDKRLFFFLIKSRLNYPLSEFSFDSFHQKRKQNEKNAMNYKKRTDNTHNSDSSDDGMKKYKKSNYKT